MFSLAEIEKSISSKHQQHLENKAIASTISLAEQQQANLASEFAKQLYERIIKFDQELDAENEVGMRLVSFGQTITFHVSDVGYYNPSMILFLGNTEGNRVELVQHVSQISFLLMALPKSNPESPKRTIGFIQPSD
ncbi:DUF6173 family protein [Tumidithrix elongata RA019]|uniref:DUF6173 family protein n=2 Tax=Tumidithrix TaxID=3088355 RepID=A0AAW9Q202_9CYAN|nr:DUF6173 family protein [Tumidithrix elongata RA019]